MSIRHHLCPLNKKNVSPQPSSLQSPIRSPVQPSTQPPVQTPTRPPVQTPTPPTPRYVPRIGDNALVRYRHNEWYLAHVTTLDSTTDRFTVYFPEDRKVKKNVSLHDIRPVNDSCTEPTRAEMLDKVFNYPGDDEVPSSKWKVRRIIGSENKYFCTCVTPNVTPNSDEFAIGYVIKCYKDDRQKRHENPFL